ncbi:MAG: hypothetical protein ACK55O_12145 [Phycisphaerales bacterium]
MRLNRQRTISLSVLGVALLGLGVDRFVLNSGAPAVAAAAVEAPVAAAGGAPEAGPAAARPAAARTRTTTASGGTTPATLDLAGLAARLDALSFAPAERDAFTPPAGWVAATPASEPVSPTPPSISAAMSGVGAIVDGEFRSVGSVVAGWTIERVEGGLVTLIDPSGQRVQRSAEPISQARRSVVRVAGEKAAADR